MRLRAVVLLAAVAVLAGCGGKHHAQTTPSTTAATTAAVPTIPLHLYFYRGAALVPTVVRVPETAAVGTAALEALLAGPPSGYTTALPSGGRLQSLSIVDGIAAAHFDSSFAGLSRSGQAQIVYTLTQFRTVFGVEAAAGNGPLVFQAGDGTALGRPAIRHDFLDLTALSPIFVEAPLRDSTVSSPVHAHGTSDVFEGTMQVDVYSGSKKIATRTVTATSGSGTPGTWQATFTLPRGPAKLDFYEPSAENGAHLHETIVHLTVR